MNALTALWLSSLVAAAFVLALGYLLGRRTGIRDARAADDDDLLQQRAAADRQRELETQVRVAEATRRDLEQRLAAATVSNSGLRDEVATLTQQLTEREETAANDSGTAAKHRELIAKQKELAAQEKKLAAQADDLSAREDDLRQRTVSLPRKDEHAANIVQISEQSRRIEELHEEIADLKALEPLAQERQALALELEVLHRKYDDLNREHESNAALRKQLAETERERARLEARQAELESERHALVHKVEVLSTRVESIDRLQADNVKLRAQIRGVEELEGKVEELRKDLKAAEARGLVSARPRVVPAANEDAPATGRGLGPSLQHTLETLATAQADNVRAAVVADTQGFVVAGVGDRTTELAALAPLMKDLWTRTQAALPLVHPQGLAMHYDDGLTVTARPLRDTSFLLATLSVGEPPAFGLEAVFEEQTAATGSSD